MGKVVLRKFLFRLVAGTPCVVYLTAFYDTDTQYGGKGRRCHDVNWVQVHHHQRGLWLRAKVNKRLSASDQTPTSRDDFIDRGRAVQDGTDWGGTRLGKGPEYGHLCGEGIGWMSSKTLVFNRSLGGHTFLSCRGPGSNSKLRACVGNMLLVRTSERDGCSLV